MGQTSAGESSLSRSTIRWWPVARDLAAAAGFLLVAGWIFQTFDGPLANWPSPSNWDYKMRGYGRAAFIVAMFLVGSAALRLARDLHRFRLERRDRRRFR